MLSARFRTSFCCTCQEKALVHDDGARDYHVPDDPVGSRAFGAARTSRLVIDNDWHPDLRPTLAR